MKTKKQNTMQEIKESSKYTFLYFFFTCLAGSILLINIIY